jgi:hypothetical protein
MALDVTNWPEITVGIQTRSVSLLFGICAITQRLRKVLKSTKTSVFVFNIHVRTRTNIFRKVSLVLSYIKEP